MLIAKGPPAKESRRVWLVSAYGTQPFRGRFCLAAAVSCTLRFLVHYVVGATIWAAYMPETFFGMTMTTPWLYSALYNGAYMLPDLVLIVAVYFALRKTPLAPYLQKIDN